MRVVTTRNLLTLSTRSTFGDAIAMCRDERINHLPVAEQGKLIGFLSDRDLKTALGQGMSQDAPITELYKREVYTLTEDATLYEAARLMDERVISGVPIVAKGTDRDLVGLVTLSDVLGHCMESLREPDQPAR